jgi:hypothetical protein
MRPATRLARASPQNGAQPASIVTVADAIRVYLAFLAAHRTSTHDAKCGATKLILPTLGNVRLSELTTPQLERCRDDLASAPALVRSAKGAPQRTTGPKPPRSGSWLGRRTNPIRRR